MTTITREKESNYVVLNWLIIILSILTFSNFLLTGFATSDDFEYYLVSHEGNIWEYSRRYAKMNGRFYYLFMHPIFNVMAPNILPTYLNQFVKLFFTYSNVILLAVIIKRLTNNIVYPYFFIVVTLIFINIKSIDNPIVSYSFYFTLSLSILLLSILSYIRYLDKKNTGWLILSLVLYIFALLFYENYIIYLSVFGFVAVYLNSNEEQSIIKTLIKQKELLFFGVIATVYIIAYVIFKKFYATPIYDGVNVSNQFSISAIFNTIAAITKGAYPLLNYFSHLGVYYQFSYSNEGHIQGVLNPIIHIKMPWLIKAILIGLVIYLLFSLYSKYKPRISKKSIIAIVFIILLVYLPQLLISLTIKYQHQATIGMWSYVTTYYSTYPIYLLIAILILFIYSRISQEKLQMAFKYFILLVFAWCSILTDYANYHASEDLRNIYKHFEALNSFVQSESMKSIPDNSTIIAPELFNNGSNISYFNSVLTYAAYFKTKLNKNITLLKNDSLATTSSAIPNIYYLSYSKNKRENDQFFVFGKIHKHKGRALEYRSDQVSLYVYSVSKDFSILIPKGNQNQQSDSISINDNYIASDNKDFKVHLAYNDKKAFFKQIKIRGSNIDPRSVILYINSFDSGKPIGI